MDVDRVSYVDYACGWNRYTMKWMGIWPEERRFNKITSYVVLIPVGFMLLFINIPQTINLYFIWGDYDSIVDNLSAANMTIGIAMLKTTAFWFHGRSMKILLSNMATDRKDVNTEEEAKNMTKIATVSRTISAGSTMLCHILVVLYVTLRLLLLRYTGRAIFYRAYFPYDTTIWPNFEVTTLGQVTAAFYAAGTYTAVDTFVAMLVLHLCGQFSNLKHQLKNLRLGSDRNLQSELERIVKKHNNLNSFADTIEERFNRMLLMQMLGCTIQLCVQCFQAILSLDGEKNGLFYVQMCFLALYISYVLLQIYLYCYIGERLFSESTDIAYAAYECNWYDLSPSEARCLILIMCRARSPLCITAGRFCSFNHELFSNILKTSMGYLSVLYAMREKEEE